jgi:serine protease Do
VLGINNAEVSNVEQFAKTLATISSGKTVAILVLRGESTLYVPIKVTDTK